MINPLRSVMIQGQIYNYESGSYSRTYPIKNTSELTVGGRHFSVTGGGPPVHSLTIVLDNEYVLRSGSSELGVTTWQGTSQLVYLLGESGRLGVLNATGSSMPIRFVSPDGVTRFVVPIGDIDLKIFNPSNPQEAGMEYRITLTLEDIT